MTFREFFRMKMDSNSALTDEQIMTEWNANHPTSPKKHGSVKRERTLYQKMNDYDHESGLAEFFSSQADLMLMQYRNIEQLLGPPDSNWTWPGEHCETLLRQVIQRHLPPSLVVCKGYIHGHSKHDNRTRRSPEVDILIYDQEEYPPLFSMDNFAIVRPESVRAAIQVKRTLDAATLKDAVTNVVQAKRLVFDVAEVQDYTSIQHLFTAVIGFEDALYSPDQSQLSISYETAVKPHISKVEDGDFLPDFIGSLTGVFWFFPGLNMNEMGLQAFRSVQNKQNVALPFLLYMLVRKIRGYGIRLPMAFPQKMDVLERMVIWKAGRQI